MANGGVTIDGQEQSTQVCHRWAVGGDCMQWITVYDYGTVSITVNGVVSSVSYNSNSTPSTLATALASAINSNTNINTLASATAWDTKVLINVTQSGRTTRCPPQQPQATQITFQTVLSLHTPLPRRFENPKVLGKGGDWVRPLHGNPICGYCR